MRKPTPSSSPTVRDAFSSKVVPALKRYVRHAAMLNSVLFTAIGLILGALGYAGISHK